MTHLACKNCGAVSDNKELIGLHPSEHCGECPPWRCADCGGMDSMTDPCSCWVSFDGMPLADIKGHLAIGELSLDHSGTKDGSNDE